jgi:hypothetical protein
MEKAQLPTPEHLSYRKHQRELWTQILLPVLIAALIVLAVIGLIIYVTFFKEGDVARWSAISTIWIVLPVIVVCVIFLVLIVAICYGMARLLKLIPPYTGLAQRYVWRGQGYVQRGADMLARPVLGLESLAATIRNLFVSK